MKIDANQYWCDMPFIRNFMQILRVEISIYMLSFEFVTHAAFSLLEAVAKLP